MTDRILSEGDGFVTLTDFVWKAVDVVSHFIQEKDPEREALKEGIQEGKELC